MGALLTFPSCRCELLECIFVAECAGDSVWPTLLVGMRGENTATESGGTVQSASHRLSDADLQLNGASSRLNDSGIELVSSASSSSASVSWLAQVSSF